MLRLFPILLLIVGLSGCKTWHAVHSIDEFTDQHTKMVTVGEWKTNNIVFTKSLKFYPFVGVSNKDVFVGIRSGGIYKIPTGTVQLRIDTNPAWTISPEETPITLSPAYPTMKTPNMPALEKVQKQMMNNITQIMSPYTATTGDKAQKIIKEMLTGSILKYRIIGQNQAGSTTGTIKLDKSFKDAIQEIGITTSSL